MLARDLERQGIWLFRWRSYLPLALIPFAVWALSLNKTYFAGSKSLDSLYEIACLCISLIGLGIRFVVHGYALEGTSGRNTREQIADNLNTTGLYSLVRHPLYLGNIL